ncbi:VOC family protein [Mesorhizobium sp. CA4]|uniref:VOC family protein n=1 Tax=Mesorhizobium sp. CA4 TaxID=588499 RepID=UPI001CD17770|nr:VOC family protein [Mesorhizobium sp. CA4]MBZ9821609.1 VOC family protein [Mesorhizobium sp. CA4]
MNALKNIRNIDYTVVFARDMKEMRRFYEDVMGFRAHSSLGEGWIAYQVGSCLLALTERGVMFHDAPTPVGALSVQLAFRVTPSQVDQCAETLREKGVAIESGPTDRPWGHRTLFFRDPDGNVLEIYADI